METFLIKISPNYRLFISLIFIGLIFCSNLEARDLPVVKNHLDFSYEALQLPNNETMGLVGGNYLFGLNKNIYTGLGVYGAVKGIRGGFFTGGFDIGWRHSFSNYFFVDINGFVGGGGGGSAPQGGGLMLRSAFNVGMSINRYSFGIGYSYIDFPNGDISSQQIAINTRYSFRSFHFSGWNVNSTDQNLLDKLKKYSILSPGQFSLQLTSYFPHNSRGVSKKEFDNHLEILGIRWRNQINKNLWLEFETGGAMLGNIDGFAQVFSGLSYENYFNNKIYGNVGFLIGAAGGGDVNSGGGLVYRTFTGIGYHLNKKWSVATQLAWTAALESQFKAKTASLNVTYHYKNLIPSTNETSFNDQHISKNIHWRKYRIRPGFQRYSYYSGSGRKFENAKNLDVNLVNLKLDSFINSKYYLTGQALGAFSGNAGGYAVGLVGPGCQINRYFSAELLGGVAGGGGIAVGSGQIVQPMFNFLYPFDAQWEIEGSVGYILAVNDDLSAVVTNLAINYRFRTPFI